MHLHIPLIIAILPLISGAPTNVPKRQLDTLLDSGTSASDLPGLGSLLDGSGTSTSSGLGSLESGLSSLGSLGGGTSTSSGLASLQSEISSLLGGADELSSFLSGLTRKEKKA
ncbi:hypothetical protein OCU04_011952 [Sclerotinia nivalis]|uniref:Uncharacterized protein n=1 Tax=Sclerotinia nivalis TaxID=352851 RepID=A0A9X0DFM0_9HELO|nr:hypothetical protein OCU04_011952 [Sclerotinia nivalis]